MNYTDWQNAVEAILQLTTDPDFATIEPRAIEYTENRLQRDLQLLGCDITDETGTLAANSRKFTLPTDIGAYIVVTEVYPIIGGVRQAPILPVSRIFLDLVWPADTGVAGNVPNMWAPYDQLNILIGPPSTATVTIGIVGEQRVAQLSGSHATNLLSTFFPDLYLACSLIFLAGYQRDYGTQAEDPQKAQSWENQYQMLLASATVEEGRKRLMGPAWSPRVAVSPTAQQAS
jgi:hypothetical protein